MALFGIDFSAQCQPSAFSDFPTNIHLARKLQGEAAITALGGRLPEVAAFYRKSPAALQKLFRADHSLHADQQGRLVYVCDIQTPPSETVAATNIGPTDVAPFSTEQTFHLHSRKGTGRVIYLDFDGHDASASGWGADAIGRPFDIDGDPNTFNATERDRIVYVWQRVAEDYAMYDIDVTTEDPGSAGLIKSNTGDTNFGIRVAIGGASTDWFGSAGGVAYLNSFGNTSLNPCWVFPKQLGPDNEKYIAEATSHEVGHTLGLNHDGRTSPVEGYYQGQGNWAPIMGVGYYEPIAQWSKGEYANANNTEDDLTVMLNYGAVYRTDDHGNTNASATQLTGVSFSTNGVISTRTDLDFFRFTTGDGRVTLNVNHAPRDSNLRLQVTLYDTNGTILQVTNVADTTSGTQPVTLTAPLAAGTYFLSVDGIGSGDPLTTGYSDYASLGQYLITGTLPSDSMWLPTLAGAYDWTNTANWASNTLPNGVGATLRLNNNLSGDQSINVTGPVTLGRLLLGDADSSHAFMLLNGGGNLDFKNLTGPAILSKASGASDVIDVPLTLSGDLVVTNNSGATLAFANNIGGPGALTKAGGGELRIEGAATHTGGTIVSTGTLTLGTNATLAGAIEVRSGAILDGSALAGGLPLASGHFLSGAGVVVGDVTVGTGAAVIPGGAGTPGTLTFSNNLVLNDGAVLRFDLAASEAPGGGTNDLIIVAGDLTLNGSVTLDPVFLDTLPASPGNYTLIRYSGALIGSAANFASVTASNRFTFTFDDTTPGEIHLLVSGAPASLVWKGDATTNRWDLVAPTNWFDGVSLVAFQQLDSVTFDDTWSVSPAENLSGALTPLSVTVNSASNYTFSGPGKISGAASVTKQGAGVLTLSNTNDFTGPVLISSGALKAGNGAALGATNSGTTIANGAQLDVNAQNLGAEFISVSGPGPGGAGAIISSGVAQNNALRFVTLTGDTAFGGTGRWDIRANPTATLAGNGFTLTKTGANAVWLVDLAGTGLGNISVNQGTLGIQDSTTLGAAASNITVEAGATLAIWNTDVNALNKKLVLNGGTLSSDSGDNIFAGTATLNTNATISVSAGLAMPGVISGAGGFTKTGAGALRLTAANTFTGAVTIAAGALRAGNSACLGSTNGGTTVASDARLDIGGINLGAEPLTVTGDGLGNAGAIVNDGASQQNALRFVTLAGNTTFGGVNRWDIRANPTASLTGNNRNLTKRGPNEVWIVDAGSTGLGAISVAEGTLGIQGTTTLGSTASNITVSSGCTLGLWATGTNNVLAKAMSLSTARIYNGNGANVFAGSCSLSGSNTFDLTASTSLEMRAVMSGAGSLWNITGGTLILSSNNTYSGVTVIKAGTLQIGNGGGFGTPGTAAITNNAALVFNRTNDFTVANVIAGTGTLTKLGAGVLTLSGASTFTGNVTLNALNAGILRLRHNNALGLGPKTLNLKSSGSPNSAGTFGVEVENNITLSNTLAWNISNDGLANSPNTPALRSRSGVNTIAGNLLIQSGGG